MTKRENFINIIEDLVRKTDMVMFCGDKNVYEDFVSYWTEFKEGKASGAMTEKGKKILTFLLENTEKGDEQTFSAGLIGLAIGMPAKSVSGSIRKLIADEYVVKYATSPVTYGLAEKAYDLTL